jgi:hypothetical protein
MIGKPLQHSSKQVIDQVEQDYQKPKLEILARNAMAAPH